MISYREAVYPEVAAGNLLWKKISPDNIHPNDKGHKMLGGFITEFLEYVADSSEDFGEITPFDGSVPSPAGYKYAEAALAGKSSERIRVLAAEGFDGATSISGFADGWRTENGGRLEIEAEFKNLGLLYGMMTEGGGSADISVDGKAVKTLSADFAGGWGNYARNEEVICFEEKGLHKVEMTVPAGNTFELLRLMLS